MKSRNRQQHRSRCETRGSKGWLWSGVRVWCVVGLVGILGSAFPKTSCAADNGPSPTITVQIYNYSQASPTILTAAEHEAGRILGKAGLGAVWLDCPVGMSTVKPEGCQQSLEANHNIRLRVLAKATNHEYCARHAFGTTVYGGTGEPGDGDEGDGAHRRKNGDALPPKSRSGTGNHRPEKLTSQFTSQ